MLDRHTRRCSSSQKIGGGLASNPFPGGWCLSLVLEGWKRSSSSGFPDFKIGGREKTLRRTGAMAKAAGRFLFPPLDSTRSAWASTASTARQNPRSWITTYVPGRWPGQPGRGAGYSSVTNDYARVEASRTNSWAPNFAFSALLPADICPPRSRALHPRPAPHACSWQFRPGLLDKPGASGLTPSPPGAPWSAR